MSHQIHQTQGLIIGGFEFGEADRMIEILTRDFGLLRARALAVRENRSKLRFVLQDAALLDLGLVSGRHHFRIVEAKKINDFSRLFIQSDKNGILARLLNLAKRLLAGQEKNQLFYIDLLNILRFLNTNSLTTRQLQALETVAVARILYHLGYFAFERKLDFLLSDNLSPSLLDKAARFRQTIIAKINQALTESQL